MESPYDVLERIVTTLLRSMDCEGTCSVKESIDNHTHETVFLCTVKTPRTFSRLLIGQHGANLHALEQIVRSIAHKNGVTQRVTIDINDYKNDRDRIITSIAKDAANQAHREKKPIVLRAMNSYERRIVHTVVGADDRVTSESIGTGVDRKVVVKPKSIMGAL